MEGLGWEQEAFDLVGAPYDLIMNTRSSVQMYLLIHLAGFIREIWQKYDKWVELYMFSL